MKKLKIAVLFSNYMYSYLKHFLELCGSSVSVDLFKFKNDKIPFAPFAPFASFASFASSNIKIENIYELNCRPQSKKFDAAIQLENEIKSLVNIENYDYFFSDTIGLSFFNACNFFHGHSEKYKIEHTSSGLLQLILKFGHRKYIKQQKEFFKNTKLCILGSSEMKRDYIENCSIAPEKIKILHPGRDNIIKADIKRESRRKLDIFILGSAVCGFQLKGGYNILRAARILKKDFTPDRLQFKLIHPNYNKQWQLKLYVKFFGLEKYTEFLPFQENINNFYSSIDCLLAAGNSEAFGRTVTEAMISKIPVIAGSNIGAADIIKDGVNGYIYEYGKNTPENLAAAIMRAYSERNSNEQLILNAEKTALKLTWESFAAKLHDIAVQQPDA